MKSPRSPAGSAERCDQQAGKVTFDQCIACRTDLLQAVVLFTTYKSGFACALAYSSNSVTFTLNVLSSFV